LRQKSISRLGGFHKCPVNYSHVIHEWEAYMRASQPAPSQCYCSYSLCYTFIIIYTANKPSQPFIRAASFRVFKWHRVESASQPIPSGHIMHLLHIVHVVHSFPLMDLNSPHISLSSTALPIHHLCLLLRKALPYALAPGHEFLYAPADAALLARD
jgi:hypothetical protein